jgi:hypothetical protein
MKKTSIIILGLTLLLAQGCSDSEGDIDDENRDEWVAGDSTSRDTVVQGKHYRSYHGSYYPVYRGFISPYSYHGSSYTQIITRSYQPSRRYYSSSGSSYKSSSGNSYNKSSSSGTSYRSSGSRSGGFGKSSSSYSSSSRSSSS